MRFGKTIAAAVVGLGLSVLTPAVTNAAQRGPAGHENAKAQPVRQEAHVQPVRDEHRGDMRDERRDDHRDDHWDGDRDRRAPVVIRHDHDDHPWGGIQVVIPAPLPVYPPDFDVTVAINQVPNYVLATEGQYGQGLAIECIDQVRSAGQTFYEFRLQRPYSTDLMLRVGVDGQFLGYL